MKVVYIGPHRPGVELVDPDTGREFETPYGVEVEVPTALGESLLEQADNYARPTANAAKDAAKHPEEPTHDAPPATDDDGEV